MSDDVKVGLAVTIFIMAVFLVLVGLVYWTHSVKCENVAEKMGVPHSFAWFQGCLIQVKGKWIPLQNYREFAE